MRTGRWKATGTLVALLTIAAATVGAQPQSGSSGPGQRDQSVDTPGYVGPAFDGQIPDIHEGDGLVITVNGVDVYDHQEGIRDWDQVREAMQDAGLLDTDQTGGLTRHAAR